MRNNSGEISIRVLNLLIRILYQLTGNCCSFLCLIVTSGVVRLSTSGAIVSLVSEPTEDVARAGGGVGESIEGRTVETLAVLVRTSVGDCSCEMLLRKENDEGRTISYQVNNGKCCNVFDFYHDLRIFNISQYLFRSQFEMK